jgi:hypothetical protein
MRFGPSALVLVVVAAASLVTALPARGKDGVRATLTTRVPLDAPAGKKLRVAWTLFFRDEQGRRQPFGAGGVFVRLTSAAGERATRALADGRAGRYRAVVRVPKGGIRRVQIGLLSWVSDANGTRRGATFFPITNDPVAR